MHYNIYGFHFELNFCRLPEDIFLIYATEHLDLFNTHEIHKNIQWNNGEWTSSCAGVYVVSSTTIFVFDSIENEISKSCNNKLYLLWIWLFEAKYPKLVTVFIVRFVTTVFCTNKENTLCKYCIQKFLHFCILQHLFQLFFSVEIFKFGKLNIRHVCLLSTIFLCIFRLTWIVSCTRQSSNQPSIRTGYLIYLKVHVEFQKICYPNNKAMKCFSHSPHLHI